MTKDKLRELQELQRATNRGGYFRCTLCNCVSNESIETDIGDYRAHMSFTPDPKHKESFICVSCNEVIQEQLDDWQEEDHYLSLIV